MELKEQFEEMISGISIPKARKQYILAAMQKAYGLGAAQLYTRTEATEIITKVLDEAAERATAKIKWRSQSAQSMQAAIVDKESITSINIYQYLTK